MLKYLPKYIVLTSIILLFIGCLEMEIIDQPMTAQIASSFTATTEIIFTQDPDADYDRRMLFGINKPTGWIINSVTYLSPEHGEGIFEYLGNEQDEPDCVDCGIDTGWENELEGSYPSPTGLHWQMFVSDKDTISTSNEEDPDTFHVTINYTVDYAESSYMLRYFTAFTDLNDAGDQEKSALDSASIAIYNPASTTVATLTITDHSWLNENIKMKGSMSDWFLFAANDAGVDGDIEAGDHVWTGQYPIFNDGVYEWGAIEDDGSEYGIWLIDGPNPQFVVEGSTITGVTDYIIPPDSAVYPGAVKFTVTDGTQEYVAIEWKGTPTDWNTVPMYDDGSTSGDEVAGDHIWTVIIDNIVPGDHEWGAIENDGTDNGIWLIDGAWENPSFNLESDMFTLHGQTDYVIPEPGGEDITKTVLFSVDMTEWLDEAGNLGMSIFSIGRSDSVQVRGSFNNWGNCTECTMTRTPGTNIFSHAINVTAQPNSEHEWAYYLHLSQASLDSIATRFDVQPVDWIGWETSPQNAGNRNFNLGEDDGTNLLELPIHSFYDVFPGAVLEQGQSMDVTFSIDMSDATSMGFNAIEDSVFLRTGDKWLNLTQGYSDGADVNFYGAVNNNDGTYSLDLTFHGPLPWSIYYKWGFKDVSFGTEIQEEGGGLGGAPRIRYFHRNIDDNCNWPSSFAFPLDETFSPDPTFQEPWDSSAICMELMDIEKDLPLPQRFYVSNNYPNPFNPTTQIKFSMPMESDMSLKIYSIAGAEVYSYTKKSLQAGTYLVDWNGRNMNNVPVASGVYFYEFRAGKEFHITKKMTLLK